MIKYKIYIKAKSMVGLREKEQRKFITCLKAGICPTCGETLEIGHHGPSGDNHVICNKGCALISPEDVDYKWLTHSVWQNCINNSISKIAVNG